MSAAFAEKSRDFDFAMPTVSFGVASRADGEKVSDVLERADLALYRAKADGRDRAVIYTDQVGRDVG